MVMWCVFVRSPSFKAAYAIIYRYKYATYFIYVGIKLFSTEVKVTKNSQSEDPIKCIGLFFCKGVYSSYDAPVFLL
jgi:hypothetical protein